MNNVALRRLESYLFFKNLVVYLCFVSDFPWCAKEKRKKSPNRNLWNKIGTNIWRDFFFLQHDIFKNRICSLFPDNNGCSSKILIYGKQHRVPWVFPSKIFQESNRDTLLCCSDTCLVPHIITYNKGDLCNINFGETVGK